MASWLNDLAPIQQFQLEQKKKKLKDFFFWQNRSDFLTSFWSQWHDTFCICMTQKNIHWNFTQLTKVVNFFWKTNDICSRLHDSPQFGKIYVSATLYKNWPKLGEKTISKYELVNRWTFWMDQNLVKILR